MGISKKDIIADYQDAIREGYQDFLMELEFVSYKDDLLHWYLLRNEVLFSMQVHAAILRCPDMFPDADVQKNPYAARHLAQLHALEDPVARLEHVAKLNEKKKTQLAELRRKVPAAFQNEPVFRTPKAL